MMGRQSYSNRFHRRTAGQIGSAEWFEANRIERAANRLELENGLKERRAESLEQLAALDGDEIDRPTS
jgi:hypothetical protein